MAYIPNTWQAREGTGLNKYTDTTTGQVLTLQSTPDSLTQEGTPFSADWMNHIENGIVDAGISGSIQQTLPVAEGVTIQPVDVVDVVDGQVTTSYDKLLAIYLSDHSGTISLGAQYSDAVKVDENHFLLIAKGNGAYGYSDVSLLMLYEISGSTVSLVAVTPAFNAGGYLGIGRLTDDTFVCVRGTSNRIFVAAAKVDIDAKTISMGDEVYTPGYDTYPSSYVSFVRLSETTGIVAGGDTNGTNLIPVTVSGTDVTLGAVSKVTMELMQHRINGLAINNGTAILTYYNYNSYYITLALATVSGTGAEATASISPTQTATTRAEYGQTVQLSDGSYAVVCLGGNNALYKYNLTISDTKITTSNGQLLSFGVAPSISSKVIVNGTDVVIFTVDNNTNKPYQVTVSAANPSSWGNTDVAVLFDSPTAFRLASDWVPDVECPVLVTSQSTSSSYFQHIFAYGFKVSSTQAFALTSGSAGQNVDIAYDSGFNFDGLEVGQSIYDGNDALIAYCPVAGKVNVIGYWKREGKQYITGTYTGTGTYGSSNPNQLEIGFLPSLVIVQGGNTNIIFIQNNQKAYSTDQPGNSNYLNTVTWNDDGILWYTTGNANVQANTSGSIYNYIAFR